LCAALQTGSVPPCSLTAVPINRLHQQSEGVPPLYVILAADQDPQDVSALHRTPPPPHAPPSPLTAVPVNGPHQQPEGGCLACQQGFTAGGALQV
jgi:hypothetical protein